MKKLYKQIIILFVFLQAVFTHSLLYAQASTPSNSTPLQNVNHITITNQPKSKKSIVVNLNDYEITSGGGKCRDDPTRGKMCTLAPGRSITGSYICRKSKCNSYCMSLIGIYRADSVTSSDKENAEYTSISARNVACPCNKVGTPNLEVNTSPADMLIKTNVDNTGLSTCKAANPTNLNINVNVINVPKDNDINNLGGCPKGTKRDNGSLARCSVDYDRNCQVFGSGSGVSTPNACCYQLDGDNVSCTDPKMKPYKDKKHQANLDEYTACLNSMTGSSDAVESAAYSCENVIKSAKAYEYCVENNLKLEGWFSKAVDKCSLGCALKTPCKKTPVKATTIIKLPTKKPKESTED